MKQSHSLEKHNNEAQFLFIIRKAQWLGDVYGLKSSGEEDENNNDNDNNNDAGQRTNFDQRSSLEPSGRWAKNK